MQSDIVRLRDHQLAVCERGLKMVMSNSMVAHNWTHSASGKGGNFTTDGERLVSYSTLVGYNTGRGLVFLPQDSMSPSTGRQLAHAQRACSHLDVVHTPYFQYGACPRVFDEKQAFSAACGAVSSLVKGLSMARLGKHLHGAMLRVTKQVDNLGVLAARYGFDCPIFPEIPADRLEAARIYAEQWNINEAARHASQQTRERARLAAQREHDADQFNRWHAGDADARCPSSYRHDETGGYYIAVRDDDRVVTSGGATCPIEHARAAVKFWQARLHHVVTEQGGHSYCEPWQHNRRRVQLGIFQLDRIDADGTAHTGCHKFSVPELERLAGILL